MAVSQRQLAANRANAQKSTGPRSEAGKEKVAQNAIKHGLCGNFQVLSCEDQQQYDDFFERFVQTEKPADDVELELVAKMARHTWLSERAMRCQEGCFLVQPRTPEDHEQTQPELPSAPTSKCTSGIKRPRIAPIPALPLS